MHIYNDGDHCMAKRKDGSYTPAQILSANNELGLYKVIFNDTLNRDISTKTITSEEIMPMPQGPLPLPQEPLPLPVQTLNRKSLDLRNLLK
jgi:hypothetical protein